MEKNGWGSIYPKSHLGIKPKIIPKNNKLFLGINCTQGGNRTHTSEETGF